MLFRKRCVRISGFEQSDNMTSPENVRQMSQIQILVLAALDDVCLEIALQVSEQRLSMFFPHAPLSDQRSPGVQYGTGYFR